MAERDEDGRADGRVPGDDEGPFVDALQLDAAHHRVRRTGRGERTAMEESDGRREARDEIELVAHEQHGAPLAGERVEELEDTHLVRDVEEGRGLVEHERVPALREGAREAYTLPLAPLEFVGVPRQVLRSPPRPSGPFP